MNLYYSRICRKLGIAKTTVWGIAVRNASNYDGILSDSKDDIPYNIVPNTPEYWFADPLLFEDNGKTWLFVEAFYYSSNKGELGVFDIIRNETLTCYNGIPGDGCGECPSCKLRAAGLHKYLSSK